MHFIRLHASNYIFSMVAMTGCYKSFNYYNFLASQLILIKLALIFLLANASLNSQICFLFFFSGVFSSTNAWVPNPN